MVFKVFQKHFTIQLITFYLLLWNSNYLLILKMLTETLLLCRPLIGCRENAQELTFHRRISESQAASCKHFQWQNPASGSLKQVTGRIFKICKSLRRSKLKTKSFSSSKKCKNYQRRYRKYLFIIIKLQKKYSPRNTIPLTNTNPESDPPLLCHTVIGISEILTTKFPFTKTKKTTMLWKYRRYYFEVYIECFHYLHNVDIIGFTNCIYSPIPQVAASAHNRICLHYVSPT